MFRFCVGKEQNGLHLRYLREDDKGAITPLIEFVPTMFRPGQDGKQKDAAEILNREAKRLRKDWGSNAFMLDLRHLDGLPPIRGAHPLEYMAERGEAEGLTLIPVTGLNRRDGYQNAVGRMGVRNGASLRITPREVLQPTFQVNLEGLVRRVNVGKENLDLVLDYEVFDPEDPTLAQLLQYIPSLREWRTFTAARGAFPKDLQGYTPGRHTLDRGEWLAWRNQTADREKLRRKPAFSDYTIQYGIYVEPPLRSNPSASIRYTLPDRWVIMRGEGIFNEDGPGHEQWVGNAQLLCDSADFYGEDFSYGDRYISDVSRGVENHGNPETWLRAGINHHLTVVARQVASLNGS